MGGGVGGVVGMRMRMEEVYDVEGGLSDCAAAVMEVQARIANIEVRYGGRDRQDEPRMHS